MSAVTAKALSWTEAGMVPDAVIRHGIRRLLERKLQEIRAGDVQAASGIKNQFVERMCESPVALVPHLANEQHYEVPAEFFEQVLGAHRKYSCCYWEDENATLDDAEAAALGQTVLRADIRDGDRVLDLGCGWGSLTLWIAQQFPNASVTAVSNSQSQYAYITKQAAARGLRNVDVRVSDMNDFDTDKRFDRVVSIEMFEHMRNYRELFRRISGWLEADGSFFMHIFTHRTTPYEFVDKGPSDWMSRHFFSGGIMPSADLPLRFAEHLSIDRAWQWNGRHYATTCNAWLKHMDSRRDEVMPILADTYGADDADRWWMRWRMFFMACAELFNFNDGDEWFVSHYRFRNGAGSGM
ncbi:MAG: cyclopropane-fatty-acyl-phospholipid synthase family protein [Woeseiaceae bacterium]|nr:cyclopropane-fatty-acyl-phospholipid synthase family protein [Woeseiaceae bacterium]